MDKIDKIQIGDTVYSINGLTVEDGESSFAVCDENGNIAIELDTSGHLKTKQFHSAKKSICPKIERGGFDADGSFSSSIASYYASWRTSYMICVSGAEYIQANQTGSIIFYRSDHSVISIRTLAKNNFQPVPVDCVYVRYMFNAEELSQLVISIISDNAPYECYNAQIRKGVTGNGRIKSEKIVIGLGGNNCTTMRLSLPYNYTTKGKAVPLIVLDAGDGSFVNWDEEIDQTGSIAPYTNGINYLNDEGFAVLVVYTWGANNYQLYPSCGMSAAIPTPISISAHRAAISYAVSRFNIDEEFIFHISKSGSGKYASYCAIHNEGYKSLYAFAPVVDGLNFKQWGAGFSDFRKALHSEMNFAGDTAKFLSSGAWVIREDENFVTANAQKFAKSTCVNWQNLVGQTIAEKIEDTMLFGEKWWDGERENIYNRDSLGIMAEGSPITIIAAADDTSTPYLAAKEFVTQLVNGGAEATLVTMEDGLGGHTAPDFGGEISNVTTKSGKVYNSIAFGWHYVVQDINARYVV
jgi:hypothetical protein